MSLPLRHALENVTSVDRILEDLLVRFIINCPNEDLSSVERELFHFEEASWFYTDFIKLMNPTLPSLKIKSFAQLIIKLCPLIWKWDIKVDEALQQFSKYKKSIPVRGAAIFNDNLSKILLVQGTESDSWSFPRGKISKDENDIDCCIREVKEEIGFDLTDYIDENQFIERNIQGKNYKIFLISGVSEIFNFKPQVRNEIDKIEWFDFKKVSKTIYKSNIKYYLINSMMRPLSMWLRHQRQIKNEDQLKSYAEEQLKLLLGITKEEQIDPGRELLNMLHTAVQANSNSNTSTDEQVPVNQEQQLSQSEQQEKQQLLSSPPQQQPSILPPLSEPFAGNKNIMPPMPMINSFMSNPQLFASMNGQPFAPFPFMLTLNNNNGGANTLPSHIAPNFNAPPNPMAFGVPNMHNLSRPDPLQHYPLTPATLPIDSNCNVSSPGQLLDILNSKKSSDNMQSNKKPKLKILQRGTDLNSFRQNNTDELIHSNSQALLDLLKKPTLSQKPHSSTTETPSLLNDSGSNMRNEDYEDFESSSDEDMNSGKERSDVPNLEVKVNVMPKESRREQQKEPRNEIKNFNSNGSVEPDIAEWKPAESSYPSDNKQKSSIEYSISHRQGIQSTDNSAYEAFESSSDEEDGKKLEELERNQENPKVISQEILKENNFQDGDVPHRDMTTDSNRSLNETAGFLSTTNTIKKAPKVKILKRGETFATLANDNNTLGSSSNTSSSKDLLQMLRNPISSTVSSNQQSPTSQHLSGEEEIMMMLKRNSVSGSQNNEETPPLSFNKNGANGSPALGMLRQNDAATPTQPGIIDINMKDNSARGLLNILKKNDFTRQPHNVGSQPNELLNMLKRNEVTENQEFNNNSSELLKVLKPNPRDNGYAKPSSEDNSHDLLNILHGNRSNNTFNNRIYASQTETSTATAGGFPLMSNSHENSSNKLLSMLQNRPTATNEPNNDIRSNVNSESNELLNILHRK
ncbi:dcp2p [Saccharomyces arboricola H-6]|uniref:Protein PSU1 n=1 Tax=Saccharomyces arboricola (strain H-6 / AS 2.3317 / CBS 10644) TaxID=1160507 RepID=J8LIX9_SACAR|nr:dcp2p [Saccharomyces arboricola H-6]